MIPVTSSERDDLDVLHSFLQEPLHHCDGIMERFGDLPGAFTFGESPERFVYVPGTREDRVVLVAHADTVWQGFRKIETRVVLDENEGCFRSLSPRYGIGADDRAGCAILWLLRDQRHSLLITDGEEQGLLGTESLISWQPEVLEELNEHRFMVQFDRCNGRDFKCYDIGTPAFRRYVGNQTGYTEPNRNSRTDIVALCRSIPGVNLSVGYRDEHTPRERLYVSEWLATLNLCRAWLGPAGLPGFAR